MLAASSADTGLRTLGVAVAASAARPDRNEPARDAANWLAPVRRSRRFQLAVVGGAAIGRDGTVTATVLNATSGNQRTLSVAVKRPGQPFGAPVPLSKPGSFPAWARTIADREGNVVVAWEETLDGGLHVVRAATRTATGELTPAQSVSDTGEQRELAAGLDRGRHGGHRVGTGRARARAATATADTPFTVYDADGAVGDEPPASVAHGCRRRGCGPQPRAAREPASIVAPCARTPPPSAAA